MPADHQPILEARGLTKKFGAHTAVDDVSLAVAPGRVIAILGPSGAGKSTLLRCLNFLIVPDAGEVWLDGARVTPKDRMLDAVRARVGMVFQQFHLFPHLTIGANVALAPRLTGRLSAKAAEARAEALLASVGLADKIHAHPAELSGGQQQRAAIARALARTPFPPPCQLNNPSSKPAA